MSAINTAGIGNILTINRSTIPNATESLRQIQAQAIAKHQAQTVAAREAALNIKA